MDYRSANCGAYSDRQRFTDELGPASDLGERVSAPEPRQLAKPNGGVAGGGASPVGDRLRPSPGDQAFLPGKYSRPEDVRKEGLNPEYWRWGLVFNQGNGMNVTEDRVRERLGIIAPRLLRKMYGNHWRGRGHVQFIVCQHGSKQGYDQHFHALMAIVGEPNGWSDFRVAMQVQAIDQRARAAWNEKLVHIDWNWKYNNRYHSYTSRFLQFRGGDDANWFIV